MSSEKIEAFWQDATADDVAEIMKTGKPIPARVRNEDGDSWLDDAFLWGWINGSWAARGAYWNHCQVYREPSWWTNKPDPGPEWRILHPDERVEKGDEYYSSANNMWLLSGGSDACDCKQANFPYRRRVEQLLSGHRWLVSGDRLESGDLYYEKGALLEVGHEYWGNKVVLVEAFMRKIEQPKPEPKHYVLRVGDSVETPSGHLIKAVSPGVEQIEYKLKAGFTAKLPNGQTIKATEKGFEVTQ
jgi:hypothetical protein